MHRNAPAIACLKSEQVGPRGGTKLQKQLHCRSGASLQLSVPSVRVFATRMASAGALGFLAEAGAQEFIHGRAVGFRSDIPLHPLLTEV